MSTDITDINEKPKKKAKAVEVTVAVVATREEPIYVMALQDGTYPDYGTAYARFRHAGTTFRLNDGVAPAKWMRVLKPGEIATLAAEPRAIPQTTAPNMRVASPFPTMH